MISWFVNKLFPLFALSGNTILSRDIRSIHDRMAAAKVVDE